MYVAILGVVSALWSKWNLHTSRTGCQDEGNKLHLVFLPSRQNHLTCLEVGLIGMEDEQRVSGNRR